MKIIFSVIAFPLLLLTFFNGGNDNLFSVSETNCNGMVNPEGIGQVPEFRWIISSSLRGEEQKAYQIIVCSDDRSVRKNEADIWDSGKTISSASTYISYSGQRLEPGRRYFWKVRAWDKNDQSSSWSKTGEFVTALFDRSDWSGAKWIGFEEIPDSLLLVPGVHGSGDNLGKIAKNRITIPMFRKEFYLDKKISHAYVFVTGLGQYELYINGSKIGDRFMSPG